MTRCRHRHLNVQRRYVGQVDFISLLRQPTRMSAGSAADIQDGGWYRWQKTLEKLMSALDNLGRIFCLERHALNDSRGCGEGNSAVWVNGKYESSFDISLTKWPDGNGCGGDHCAATYIDMGKKEWWAKIRLKSGQTG